MTLLLRRMRAQAHIEGLDPNIWSEDDYAVVDETRIGRIYKEPIHGEPKWLWFLQTVPAPPPNQGIADTLDEAKAALKKRYEEMKRGEMMGRYARNPGCPLENVVSPENGARR
jgi:hypothetical protein